MHTAYTIINTACIAGCTGLERCDATSALGQTCCNFFDLTGSCVLSCPANSSPTAQFDCECDIGYSPVGAVCIEDNECDSDPCQNGATCTDLLNDFNCTCAGGFEGKSCQIDTDDCDPNPCQNGGTCTDLVDSYRCFCEEGYSGDSCETDVGELECVPNPCENGGSCIVRVDGFVCECSPGYLGPLCLSKLIATYTLCM